MIFDRVGRLLILKPNYKKGWTIPGGQIDANGESPWEACQRERWKSVVSRSLRAGSCASTSLRPKPSRPGGVRFLFDCGTLGDRQLSAIRLQDEEIDEHRFVELDDAAALLSGPVRRRVRAGVHATQCVYLEDGHAVAGVKP